MMRRTSAMWMMSLIFLLMFCLSVVETTFLFGAEKEAKKRGYLGVTTQELTRHQKKELKADFGVVITEIEEDSPADRDGLMEDDVIQWVNDVKITRPSTLARVIRSITPGEKAKVVVIRDGKEKTIMVTIGRAKSYERYELSIPHPRGFFGWYQSHRPFLGVQLYEINDDLAKYFGVKAGEGVLILDVAKNSPAEKAGLKSGDVIVKIDNESVATPKDVQEIISEFEEDEQVTLEIVRKNQKQTITVTLEEYENEDSFIDVPQRMIREFRWLNDPEKSIELLVPKIAPNIKDREIIIKKKTIDSRQTI